MIHKYKKDRSSSRGAYRDETEMSPEEKELTKNSEPQILSSRRERRDFDD